MEKINTHLVLKTLIKHETLTINDLAKEENLGIASNAEEVQPLLEELEKNGCVDVLDNVKPITYTITKKGILEGKKTDEATTN